MSSLNDYKSELLPKAKKYLKDALRYTLVFILWLIKEISILTIVISYLLSKLWKITVKYSVIFWNWLKLHAPVAWAWIKRQSVICWHATCTASVFAWHWTCKTLVYVWSKTKVLVSILVRLMFIFFWHLERWAKTKREEYVEFKRTKGVKGLVKDAKVGMRMAVNRYMDEDQVASTEVVFSDDELIDEEMGQEKSIQIGKKFDKFVKKIVNEQ